MPNEPDHPDASESPSIPPGLRVLVVEDTATSRIFLTFLLDKHGCRTEGVENGPDALSALAERPFDLILLDIQMPVMDGLDVLAHIRRGHDGIDPRSRVIALTAHASPEDRQTFLAAGMDDFVAKPVVIEDLFAAMNRVLQRDVAKAAPENMAGPDADPDVASLEEAQTLRRFEGNRQLLDTLRRRFIEAEAPALLTALDAALAADRPLDVTAKAHALKGACGTVGAERARELARELELTGRAGDLAAAPALLARLRGELDRVAELLAQTGRDRAGHG